jgi:hypothetical protein
LWWYRDVCDVLAVIYDRHDPLEKQIRDSEQTGNLKAPKLAEATEDDDMKVHFQVLSI